MGRVFCTVRYPDGRPFEGDGRHLLRKAQQDAAREGYELLVGPECEFYLFETDENGRPTRRPFDRAGYFDVAPADRGENVRREICLTLEEMGIQPERSHHEQGPGQNEIDFRCSSPLAAADDLMAMRTAVKAVGRRQRAVRLVPAQTPAGRERQRPARQPVAFCAAGATCSRALPKRPTRPPPRSLRAFCGACRRSRSLPTPCPARTGGWGALKRPAR